MSKWILIEQKDHELLAETKVLHRECLLFIRNLWFVFLLDRSCLEVVRHLKSAVERTKVLQPELADDEEETRHTGHLSDQIKVCDKLDLRNLSLLI